MKRALLCGLSVVVFGVAAWASGLNVLQATARGLDQSDKTSLRNLWRLLLRAFPASVADSLHPVWVAHYAQTDGPSEDYGVAAALDSAGNVVAVGQTVEPATGLDILTVKVSPQGQVLWRTREAGVGMADDFARGVNVTPDGDVLVLGSVWTDGGYRTLLLRYSPDGELRQRVVLPCAEGDWQLASKFVRDAAGRVFVLGMTLLNPYPLLTAVDPEGRVLWQRQLDSFGGDTRSALGTDLLLDRCGHLSVVASVWDAQHHRRWGIAQLDAHGSLRWSVTLPREGEPRALAALPNGDVAVAGLVYDPGPSSDVYVVRLDTSGSVVWQSRFASPEGLNEGAADVVADRSGNVYVGGVQHSHEHDLDVLALKIDSAGTVKWTTAYDGAAHKTDRCTGIGLSRDGSPVVVATSEGEGLPYQAVVLGLTAGGVRNSTWISPLPCSVQGFAVGDGVALTGRYFASVATGNEDFWVAKLDSAFALTGQAHLDGPGSCSYIPSKLVLDRAGNAVFGGNSVTRTGASHWAVVKFSPEGSLDWSYRYEGGQSTQTRSKGSNSSSWKTAVLTDLAVDSTGRVLTTGWTAGQHGNQKWVTMALDADGAVAWQVFESFPINGQIEPYRLAIDPDGNTLVAGEVFDVDAYAYELLVAKYDRAGERLWWFARIDTPSFEPAARWVLSCEDGRILVSGGPYVLAKLDSLGHSLWQIRASDVGTEFVHVRSVVRGVGGRVAVVAGGHYPKEELLVCEISRSGELLWYRWDARFAGYSQRGVAAVMRTDGSLVVAGTNQSEEGAVHVEQAAWSSTGEPLWDLQYGEGEDLDRCPAGMVLDRDGSTVTLVARGTEIVIKAVLLRVDTDGRLVSEVECFPNSPTRDLPVGVALYPDGDLSVAVSSTGLLSQNRVVRLARYTSRPLAIGAWPGRPVLPRSVVLRQNFPNPFNGSTEIRFSLPRASHVRVDVYDVRGRRVTTVLNKRVAAGRHSAVWTPEDLPSGVYVIWLWTGTSSACEKALFVK